MKVWRQRLGFGSVRRVVHAASVGLAVSIAGCGGGEGPPDVTLVSIDLSPASTTLQVGTTQTFSATGHFSDGSSSAATVNWSATGGTISPAGVYSAGSVPGNFQVVATEQGGSLSKAAAVTITAAPPVLTSISVAPATIALAPAATQQFVATGHYSGGGTGSVAVSWTATGGAITPAGLYTAGSVDGAYQVTATATGGGIAGSASVTITTPPPNIVAIEVSPAGVRLKPGDPAQFTAVGRLSTGGTTPVPVDWTVTSASPSPPAQCCNTIAADGRLTAGGSVGTYVVTATLQGGSLAGTVPFNVHQTGGNSVVGPNFWNPSAGIVYLCTSNHFTDDALTNGAVATITANPATGVLVPTVTYTNSLAPVLYASGDGEVAVVCQQVWSAPVGLVGTVSVTIDVVSNRPGTGMAKGFVYTKLQCFNPPPPAGNGLERPCGRADFTAQLPLPDPNWTTLPVTSTVSVSATTGANIWFKNTDVP